VVGRAHSRLALLALLVLLVALGAGIGLRVHAQHQNPNVQYDEAWSYASAAGRLDEFVAAMDGGLTGRWVPAAEWQRLWRADGFGDVGRIAPDLAAHDVHPPLYFALLHGWLALLGDDVWTGRALNLVFATLTILGIYGLARAVGLRPIEGALAALVWAVSPAVVGISSIARQYDLVALTAVLLVWGLVRATAADGMRGEARSPAARRWLDVAWLGAATAAALLTHYQAALLVAGAAVYVLVAHRLPGRTGERASRWAPLVGLGAGTAAAALASGWTHALGNERAMLVAPSFTGLVGKLAGIGDTAGQAAGAPGTLAAIAALAIAVAFAVPRSRRALLAHLRGARPGWWSIAFFLAVTAGGIVLQNLLFLSMPLRLSPRYLAMAWPFAAFVPLAVFGLWPRARLALAAAFCALLAVLSIVALPVGAGDPLQIGRLVDADAVIVNGVGVGRLPRFLWSVPADTPVFVGDADQILRAAGSPDDPRAGALRTAERIYFVDLSGPSGSATAARADAVLAEFERGSDVLLLDESETAGIYLITPRGTD
jgi:hypothetical protein